MPTPRCHQNRPTTKQSGTYISPLTSSIGSPPHPSRFSSASRDGAFQKSLKRLKVSKKKPCVQNVVACPPALERWSGNTVPFPSTLCEILYTRHMNSTMEYWRPTYRIQRLTAREHISLLQRIRKNHSSIPLIRLPAFRRAAAAAPVANPGCHGLEVGVRF